MMAIYIQLLSRLNLFKEVYLTIYTFLVFNEFLVWLTSVANLDV